VKKGTLARRENAAGAEPDRLWLIRHAHAGAATQDAVRPLSKRGRGQVRSLARFLGAGEAFCPAAIWHSPLMRSQQTAKLLVRHLALAAPMIRMTGLKPEDDARVMARRLTGLRDSVAIVGHEPHLSALASLLVTGTAAPAVFVLKKCAALALGRVDGRWVVHWQISPEVLA
jgi:phosphohistidine phosphatase